MQTIRFVSRLAFLLAPVTPALAAATVAGSGATGASPNAQVVEVAHLRHQVGKYPQGGVILASDGNYYGTARAGGSHGFGTVFRVGPTGEVKALHDFKGEADGREPMGALVQGADGALYGVANGSLDRNFENTYGVIFRVTLDGEFDVLHALDESGSEGQALNAPLIQSRDGKLYGTTMIGGYADQGVVFSVTPAGGYALVAQFPPGQGVLDQPRGAPLEGDDGELYIAADVGGHGRGGIVRVSPRTGKITTLYEFGLLDDGGYPRESLVYDAAHEYLWGVSYWCVYRYRIQTAEAEAVHCFEHAHPSMVTLGPDGTHFYVQVEDKVHSIAPDGTVETIAHLPGKGGRTQQLIIDPAGALVGTTTKSGARDAGTVFKIVGY